MIYLQNLTNEFCELRKQYIDAKFMTMNPMQKKAIYNVDGPVLVLAGAGSGKTTTIIGRIVYMVMFGHAYYSTKTTFPVTENDIKELKSVLAGTGSISEHLKSMLQVKPVSPQNIMAVTFTNKAAGEMKKRLESKLGKDMAEKVYAKTFHSACVGILREYAMFVGFKRDFAIYDEKDCKSVLKDIYKANGIKEKELHKDDVLNHISIWKDKMITPDMAISQSTISSYNTVAHLYKEYQERLKNANAMDFDDLIGNTIRLLKEHPDIQAELQKKIQYIMVDEYQDTNASQHELLSLLVSPEHNICVVGDDDQSIYSFRGADVDNILNFPQEFNGTHIIKMVNTSYSSYNTLGKIEGAFQLSFPMSYDPIRIASISNTRCCVSSDDERKGNEKVPKNKDRTMGRFSVVEYGLYHMYIQTSTKAILRNGVTEDDLKLLIQTILHMFDDDMSSVRPSMTVRKVVVVRQNRNSGRVRPTDIEDAMVAKLKPGVNSPTSFNDYNLEFKRDMLPDSVEVKEYTMDNPDGIIL